MTEETYAPLKCRMAFAATTSFENLGPFVLSPHSLPLQEHLILWGVPQGPSAADTLSAVRG
jgi:hypothetical protein